MLVNEPSCIIGPFNCPAGLKRSRKVADFETLSSVPPPMAVMTPLFQGPDELAKCGVRWQPEQLAPPLVLSVTKSCFPLFSLSLKFGNGSFTLGTRTAPASYFESKDSILRMN